jgi:hypothetical protein
MAIKIKFSLVSTTLSIDIVIFYLKKTVTFHVGVQIDELVKLNSNEHELCMSSQILYDNLPDPLGTTQAFFQLHLLPHYFYDHIHFNLL